MTRTWHARSAGLAVAAMLAGLASGGCVTGGLALMGPLVGAVYAVADRSVERALPADLDGAWTATVEGLSRVSVRIKDVDRTGASWSLTGVGDNVTLRATLVRITPTLTKLSLRVEDGGITADKKSAEEILNQVSAVLAGPPAGAVARRPVDDVPADTASMAALKREIERLGSKLDGPGAQRPAASAGVPVVEHGRILVVPPSLGVASVPWNAIEPAAAPAVTPVLDAARVEPAVDPAPRGGATALRAVEGLTPVAGLAPPAPTEQ